MQSMYELVGDKIQEIFDAQVVDIGLYDFEKERNSAIRTPLSAASGYPMTSLLGLHPRHGISFATRKPIVVNDVEDIMAAQPDPPICAYRATCPRPWCSRRLISGGKAFGRISLQNLDRKNAFSDADVRLLTTLAASLSVALENARLFDETQRLLTETNERAAELAIINSVQQGLAENLDMQSMYDLVGDKVKDIFDAQTIYIGTFDESAEVIHYPYLREARARGSNGCGQLRLGADAEARCRDSPTTARGRHRRMDSRTWRQAAGRCGRADQVRAVRAAVCRRQHARRDLTPELRSNGRLTASRTCGS